MQIQASEDQSTDLSLKPVRRPWYVYLMAIWAFFGIGGFSMSLSRVLSIGNPQILPILGSIVLAFIIVLIVNIIKMKKVFLIVFGVCSTILVLWHGFNLFRMLSSGGQFNPMIFFFLFYLIPSIVMAALSLRPKFLSLADNFRKYENQEAMMKIAMKRGK